MVRLSNEHHCPHFIVYRGSGGTYRQHRRLVEETWVPSSLGEALPGVGYHCLSIVGPRLLPKVGCECNTPGVTLAIGTYIA
jgi:hypothetical protein